MGTLWVRSGWLEGRLEVVTVERQMLQTQMDIFQEERDMLVVEVATLRA